MTADRGSRLESFARLIERHARERPKDAAIVSGHGTVTFGELPRMVAGCANWLGREGVSAGDRVGVTIPDNLLNAIVTLGLAVSGAAFMTLPSFEPEANRARLAQRFGVGRVIGAASAQRLPGLRFSAVDAEQIGRWRRAECSLPPPQGPDAPFAVFATSGTTGESKLIPVAHGQMALMSLRTPSSRTLPLPSVEHGYSLKQWFHSLRHGSAVVFRDPPEASIADLCREHGVEVVGSLLGHVSDLLAAGAKGERLPAGMILRIGGARVSAQVRRDLLREYCEAVQTCYGVHEVGFVARTTERSQADVTETVGRPFPGVEIAIVDPDGRALPHGETGTVRLRAPGMATGYLDDPAATARHFVAGWFQPGDLGTMTPDGALIVHGRADDVMILNSIKIAPAEIERALERHPAVKAVAAFPVRSPVHGEVPVAAVELRDGMATSERELQDYARQLLGLRAPRRVMVVPALPATNQGKIDKRRLAQMHAGRSG